MGANTTRWLVIFITSTLNKLRRYILKAIIISALALTLSACGTLPEATQPKQVSLNFSAQINGQAFECGKSYANVGATRSTITPSDFRMYVSEVNLLRQDGSSVPVQLTQDGVWQYQNVALIDFENGTGPCRNGTSATNTSVRGTVPTGDYVGVVLTVGVPFAQNHQDPTVAPAPLNSTAMFWNWQGGYKFIKFDTTSSGISEQKPATANAMGPVTRYSVHLGSTACAGESRTKAPSACQNPNRIVVSLPHFDLAKNTVVLDMGAVLAQANVDVNAKGTSPGCMSFLKDADCPPVMNALGLAYDGVAASGPQRLLSKR
jgi:uncharacterized repeat protein (TIGR04052 family)